MSNIAEIRAKFAGTSAPTPENQQKKIADEIEKQKRAVRVARAKAARYNMTLRSLALKTTQEQKKLKEMEREKLEKAKAEAAKYNATKRALMIQNARPTRKEDIDNLNLTLNQQATPQIAQELMEVVAINEMSVEELIAGENAEKGTGKGKEEVQVQNEKAKLKEDEKKDEELENDEVKSKESSFKLNNIAKAVKEGKGINRAILADFLEIYAPEELKNLDSKLKEYAGREQLLFDYYTEKYPMPYEAEEEGVIKADNEVFGKEEDILKESQQEKKEELDEVQEKVKQAAYEKTIKEAEEDEEKLEENFARYEKRKSNDERMEQALEKYEAVRTNLEETTPSANEGYIVEAALEKSEEDNEQVQWAVKIKSANQILEDKLVQQGVSQDKAKEIAEAMNDENNLSEML